MAAITIGHFDALDYVDKSKSFGANEELAKYQARQFEHAINIAINNSRAEIENKELATKKDIKELDLKIEQVRAEIYKSKFEIVIWIAGMFIASGFIEHFFK